MAELRLNLVTREWVIIATERAKNPEEFVQHNHKTIPAFAHSCPFCPGNELRTPGEVMRATAENGWRVRVTQNKFPALSPEGEKRRTNKGLRHLVTGVGRHEIIIESPVHNMHTAFMGTDDLSLVIRTYRERFIELYRDPRVEYVMIFKNYGEEAGTSLLHPHAQIIGTPITPLLVRNRKEEQIRYFDNTGHCLLCELLHDELNDGERIILITDHFVAFIPFAALSPFHTWIFPKRHCATFGSITDTEIADLSLQLKSVLLRFYEGLENPDFNYVIRSHDPNACDSEYLHWYLSIVPRITQTAGFELGSGIYINTAIPEKSAAFLRSVKV
jgi:UDPglucose--hexose-1-phosphate uridylyltransferase